MLCVIIVGVMMVALDIARACDVLIVARPIEAPWCVRVGVSVIWFIGANCCVDVFNALIFGWASVSCPWDVLAAIAKWGLALARKEIWD